MVVGNTGAYPHSAEELKETNNIEKWLIITGSAAIVIVILGLWLIYTGGLP